MVFSLAITDATYYISFILSFVLALLSKYFTFFAYLSGLILLFTLYTLVVSVPLSLNWSRNFYSRVLVRSFLYVFFTSIVYAVCFYLTGGAIIGGKQSAGFIDCLYFSFSTFTSLGYGDITPRGNLRLLSSMEAMNGLLAMPIIASIMWLYCKEQLSDRSMAGEEVTKRDDLALKADPALGVWRELPNETKAKQEKRRDDEFHLFPCSRCGSDDIHIEKFWDLRASFSPFPIFVVICECGVTSEIKRTAYSAVVSWNLLNEASLNNGLNEKKDKQQKKNGEVAE